MATLLEGTTYDELTEGLEEGEVLAATWRPVVVDYPHVRLVFTRRDFDIIRRSRYRDLRWFVSVGRSVYPPDYGLTIPH